MCRKLCIFCKKETVRVCVRERKVERERGRERERKIDRYIDR